MGPPQNPDQGSDAEGTETPTSDSPDTGETGGRARPKLDKLSLAAVKVVALAVAIFATLVIVEVFGNSEDDPVDVTDAFEPDEGAAEADGNFSVGSSAPDVDFEMLGGGSSSVSELLGTPAVINFWSSTCAPCLAEMPDFETVNQELGGEVAFLGVDVVDTEQAGLDMVEQTGITYPSARDPKGEVFNAFGGTALPRTVILDSNGTVVEAVTGQMDADELNEALEKAGVLP